MTKKELTENIKKMCGTLESKELTRVTEIKGEKITPRQWTNVVYGSLRRHMSENLGRTPEYTFAMDIAIAEPFGKKAVIDTIATHIREYIGNVKASAELILQVNYLSWLRYSVNPNDLGIDFFNEAYWAVKDIVYEYYDDDKEALSYLFEYLD